MHKYSYARTACRKTTTPNVFLARPPWTILMAAFLLTSTHMGAMAQGWRDVNRHCKKLRPNTCRPFVNYLGEETPDDAPKFIKVCRGDGKKYDIHARWGFYLHGTYNLGRGSLDELNEFKKSMFTPGTKNYNLTSKWISRIKECWQLHAHQLKDEYGNTLRLVPDSTLPDVFPTIWAVDPEANRSYSARLAAGDIENCSNIIHETLHRLGLHDEYDVRHPDVREVYEVGPRKDYASCRYLGSLNSLMRRPSNLLPRYEVAYRICVCKKYRPDDLGGCRWPFSMVQLVHKFYEIDWFKRYMQFGSSTGGHCPSGYQFEAAGVKEFRGNGKQFYDYIFKSLRPGLSLPDLTKRGFRKFFIIRSLKRLKDATNLIQPAQMSAIIYPNCVKRNRRYYQCVRRSSLFVPGKCAPAPNRLCENEDAWTSSEALDFRVSEPIR